MLHARLCFNSFCVEFIRLCVFINTKQVVYLFYCSLLSCNHVTVVCIVFLVGHIQPPELVLLPGGMAQNDLSCYVLTCRKTPINQTINLGICTQPIGFYGVVQTSNIVIKILAECRLMLHFALPCVQIRLQPE